MRSEFTPDRKAFSFSLGDQDLIPYKVADPNDPAMQLTVRDTGDGPRRVIPRAQWQFARDEKGKPDADPGSVFVPAGLEPGKIYELVYTGEDPWVVGLGPAGVRDLISFLKFGAPGDGVTLLRHAIEERYRDRAEYLGKVRAAEGLAAASFLRQEDVAAQIAQAGEWWDALMT